MLRNERGGQHLRGRRAHERRGAAPEESRERRVDRREPARVVRRRDRRGGARDDVLVKALERPVAVGLLAQLVEEARVVERERRRRENGLEELGVLGRQRHASRAVADREEREEPPGDGQGRERAEPCAPEARDGCRRACREILARQARRPHAGPGGKLRERQRRASVDVPGDERVLLHGQERRARDAETPRNPIREEALQVPESTRRRQLADEREQALAIPPGLAILKALRTRWTGLAARARS